ncbi:IRK-interacting protein [Cardamine amara subsp. amara]|uniref:IRK-interacting protein n=1 Tax=Cardamine amara subsp. amara TaxID=228776 RepID=A0ABD0ZWW7_CARAN
MASSETRMNKGREKEEAIANGVKMRAFQAGLMHKSSPSSNYNIRIPSSSSAASPASRPLSNLSAHDYPVFTPSYEDEPVSAFHHKNLTLSEIWDEDGIGLVDGDDDQDLRLSYLSDSYKTSTSRKTLVTHQDLNNQSQVYTMSDALRSPPPLHFYTSGRSNCGSVDFRSVSSCNENNKQRGFDTKSLKSSNLVVPLTDSHSSVVSSQPRNRGGRMMSWLFPKLKKKQKSNSIYNSPNRTEKSEEVSEVLKDSGSGVEKLKRELMEANRSRDAALTQVSEMKASLGELSEKLQYLESYCDSLKKALREATEVVSQENSVGRGSGKKNSEMPVSEEVMVEGFLQIVSESRLSIKQFLKTLVSEIDEEDSTLISNINTILQPHNLSFTSKYSKIIQCHLEAIISQCVYQDFENCVFQKNGKLKILDPEQDRQANFSSFASLRNLSWNEVLKKGTKYYSEEFSRFCDEKMSLIITTLNWTRPWSEQMLQAFFVAAKCVWLLHLLAFSFNPALGILRVEENRVFESSYMEDIGADRDGKRSSSSRGQARVKVMVMPGFYVQDRVLRCKVLCRYKSI